MQFLRTFLSRPSLLGLMVVGMGPGLATDTGADDFGVVHTKSVPTARDNTLYESATGALSNGAGEFLFAGTTGQGVDDLRRGLLFFDLASELPPDASVDSVSLRMRMSASMAGDTTVSLFPATADWGEGTSDAPMGEGVGAPSTAGDATWIHTFFDTQTWSMSGGDFGTTASAASVVGGNGSYTWGPTVEMVTDVQSWIDTPADNFGWVVVGDEDSTPPTAKRFNSRQNSLPSSGPRLIVSFLSASTIFLDGFESGDTAGWSASTGGP